MNGAVDLGGDIAGMTMLCFGWTHVFRDPQGAPRVVVNSWHSKGCSKISESISSDRANTC